MKLCKDCVFYRKGPSGQSYYSSNYIPEHGCAASVSVVTGETELRDAISMRGRSYIYGSCGQEATLFQRLHLKDALD